MKKLWIPILMAAGLLAADAHAAGAPKEIVIGASLPQSGPLAPFGFYGGWGYKAAIDDVNAKGGVYLKDYDTKVPVRLVVYDDESRPEQTNKNVERLVVRDGVNALLGSVSPPLVISGAVVAEREHLPFIAPMCPVRAFLGGNENGWQWSWNLFFDELDMTRKQLMTMDTVESNKKVALFTDNEQDGVIMGGLWNQNAPDQGYEVVYYAKFPIGTTDYGDLIRRAQEANAEIVIAQMVTPDAIALWKQMRALNYVPKAAFFEKGGAPAEWWAALGDSANGTMVSGYWHPKLPFPGAAELKDRFVADTGKIYNQDIASAYTAAAVLLDAMEAAGSADPAAVNAAIGKTDKDYVVGHVKFTTGKGERSAVLPAFMLQWQSGDLQVVYPKDRATADMIYPIK